ncbi:transcription factor MYBS3 [Lolium perenne]|uniref:transcription factor MYBS3 n=1 Tax=Lolium perenne TaxID=4522 RepID=UPI0021EB472D|nr:transcription factor MYBS3-like [Lolium perenne]
MTRRCSHCSNNGHNARTCPARGLSGGGGGGGVRLFGVQLTSPPVAAMKKSASMSCIASSLGGGSGGSSPAAGAGGGARGGGEGAQGYVSDDAMHASCSTNGRGERKKGTPWTEEEHRMFLLGLQKLGKGDWRGISRSFVVSRTPTQVASHAQKYFIRQTNSSRRKRRSSLFDMVPVMPMDESPDGVEEFMLCDTQDEGISSNKMSLFHIGEQDEAEFDGDLPTLQLRQHQESEFAGPSLEAPNLEMNHAVSFNAAPVPIMPTFYPELLPSSLTLWPTNVATLEEAGTAHEVLKPTPLSGKEGIKADEIVSMSKLSIGDGSSGSMEPSALSLQLTGSTNTRQSAFHVNPSMARTDLSNGNNSPIHAV